MKFVELNGYTELPLHPMPDCETVIDRVARWNVLLSLDVKVAYNKFPIDPACQPYYSIETQGWVYMYHKMIFGFNVVPCYFQ